jgi:hypothetical protein
LAPTGPPGSQVAKHRSRYAEAGAWTWSAFPSDQAPPLPAYRLPLLFRVGSTGR